MSLFSFNCESNIVCRSFRQISLLIDCLLLDCILRPLLFDRQRRGSQLQFLLLRIDELLTGFVLLFCASSASAAVSFAAPAPPTAIGSAGFFLPS
jgi:hypothetical protein